MTVYEHTTSITVTAGSLTSTTLRVPGGLIRQFLVRANTLTTIFKATLKDASSDIRKTYDFHEGELIDDDIELPIQGVWTIDVTNISPNDTFKIILAVQE